jgi:hypothetical protein
VKLVQPLWISVWRFLKKTKYRSTIWSCSTIEVSMQQRSLHTHVNSSTVHNSQVMESPSIDEWIHIYIYIHNLVLSRHKEEWNHVVCK